MANKRDIKKFIRNTCGALAAEIIFARAAFPQIDRKEVYDIVTEIATLQGEALAKVSVAFDKTPRDFDDARAYHKARTAYYSAAFTNLLDTFDQGVAAIVKRMNAALPEDVRATLKAAAAE